MPQLCLYDILVVDPHSNFNPEDCKGLNQTYAYVSLGEIPKDFPLIKKIKADWILGQNKAWNKNFIIDQTQKSWQTFFINEIIAPLWNRGYRGFFFDTLDSYYITTHDPKLQQKQIDSMVSLIQQIKVRYPQAKIILNRGFKLLPQVQHQIDAVVIESLYQGWYQEKNAYKETPPQDQKYLWDEITKIRAMNIPIIIIDYLPPDQQQRAQQLAEKLSQQGFIPWITNNQLHQIYLKSQFETLHVLPRKILIVYTDENKLPIRFIAPLRIIAPILEYLGYIPKFLELNEVKKLQKNDLSSEYAGVILWLGIQDAKNVWLLDWVQKQIKANIPIVFLNGFGVPVETPALAKLGLSISTFKNAKASLEIVKKDSRYVGYEVNASVTPYDFFPLKSASSQVLLQLKNDQNQTEDAIAITNWGGYAMNPYVVAFLPDLYALWVINPFEFFPQALKLNRFPIPDTTTENGRRLMTVHIDGDGFAYPAKWIGGGFAATELLERVLKKYRIPTSVSVITGEIAPNGIHPKYSKQLMNIARSIFALPWVESASHSFSHPFHWQTSEHKVEDLQGFEPFSIQIPHYKFDLATEITGSINFINQNLVPAHKKCQLFFWSGAADPSIEALSLLSKNSLLNINGVNDTFIDRHRPSLTGIRPMGIDLAGKYQVFAPIDMDFYYMNSFAGPMYGFERVIQTLQLTDKPRRFKPIDLYYHIYSASYPASLQALTNVYHWALKQPVMNVYISDYIKKVLDFYHITIAKYHSSWIIYSKGDLRELRSERQLGYPDLIHSHNVTGFKENKEDFYIHLGPNHLSVLYYQQEKPIDPYLVEANARVIAFLRDARQLMIRFQGYMPVQFTLANIERCSVVSSAPLNKIQRPDNAVSYQSSKEYVEIHINC